jgi:hypothetical protein
MKRNRQRSESKCTCDKCGTECVSVRGTTHRRCPGAAGIPLRKRHERIVVARRGTWFS